MSGDFFLGGAGFRALLTGTGGGMLPRTLADDSGRMLCAVMGLDGTGGTPLDFLPRMAGASDATEPVEAILARRFEVLDLLNVGTGTGVSYIS